MKRTTKILSLMLALAMIIAMLPTMASATYEKFTDAADIYQETAANILTALGIFEGFPDGSFRPYGTLTRAQAAAIIARLLLTRSTADRLPKVNTRFSDVGINHWASEYIGYCTTNGIIEGYPDGTFKPENQVTGSQFASMLLRSLGYGKLGEYVGRMWEINAITHGVNYGILADVPSNVDFSAPATREEAAQYALNMLLPTAVSDTNAPLQFVYWSADIQNYTRVEGPHHGSVRDVIYKDILDVTRRSDALARPYEEWNLGDTHLADIYFRPVFEAGEPVSQGRLYTGLGLYSTRSIELDIYFNGVLAQNMQVVQRGEGDHYIGDYLMSSTALLYNFSGNGIVTQVYHIGKENTPTGIENYIIVMYNVYVAEVYEVVEENYYDDRHIYLSHLTGPYSSRYYYAKYYTEDFDEEEIVLYTWSDSYENVVDVWYPWIDYVDSISITDGVVTDSTGNAGANNGTFRVEGELFWFVFNLFSISNSDFKAGNDDNWIIYRDDFGYVVYLEKVHVSETVDNYLHVLEVYQAGLRVEADVLFFADDTVETIIISQVNGEAPVADVNVNAGETYAYELDGSRYRLYSFYW